MTDIHMADVSEFQSDVAAPEYIAAGHACIICRTHNGYRPDHKMPGRRDYLRDWPFTGVGWYQYLAADRDPAAQAHEFIATVGELRGNEWPVLDLEEGAGDQTARAHAWFAIVDAWAGFPAMLYSGASFLEHQLSGAGHWAGRPVWIASYGSGEPGAAHTLWQFASNHPFPGIGACDGSVHHGPADEFVSSVRAGRAGAGPPPPTEDDFVSIAAAVSDSGVLHVFYEHKDGSLFYTFQPKGKSGWEGGESGKRIAGLKPFAPAPK